jgi:hypothetical protein
LNFKKTITPIGTYNGESVCKCISNCSFKSAWEKAGKPTHFPAEMALNRFYSPPDDLKDLYDFTRTKHCLNR